MAGIYDKYREFLKKRGQWEEAQRRIVPSAIGGVLQAFDALDYAADHPTETIRKVGRAIPEVPGLLADSFMGWMDDTTAFGYGDMSKAGPSFLGTAEWVGLPGAAASRAAGGVGDVIGMNVYQGGPHKYGPEGAAESLKHIGKGEGAAAYGWGRYDAGSQRTGEIYQGKLSGWDVVIDGGAPNWDDPRHIAALKMHDYGGDIDGAILDLKQTATARSIDPENKKIALESAELLEAKKDIPLAERSAKGYLYTHDLPDEDIARYMDWDAPLSEQGEIGERIANLIRELRQSTYTAKERADDAALLEELGVTDAPVAVPAIKELGDTLGGGAYQELVRLQNKYGAIGEHLSPSSPPIKRGDKAASEALARAGIPGLKYYDGMSRGAGDGTRNYVTWDQDVLNRMKLLERDGEVFGVLDSTGGGILSD